MYVVGRCGTFDNPPLCSKAEFEVSQLEVSFCFAPE
ncbi:unnamed protein product [Discosporangium mesarthrocarpum]